MENWVWAVLIIAGVVIVGFLAEPFEAKKKAEQERRARAHGEAIEPMKSSFLESSSRTNIPVLDASSVGYRPVTNENLLAIQDGVARVEYKSTGKYTTQGTSFSVPIVKGVRYRVGSGSIRAEKAWTTTAEGRLLLTDRAIVFEGSAKNERITWGQVADVEQMLDGFQIARRSGPPRLFSVAGHDPKFRAILELMLART